MQLKPVSFGWDYAALDKSKYASLPPSTFGPTSSHPSSADDPAMHGKQIGFIAQDVEKVLPSVVVTEPTAEKVKGMKYSELIPVLVKAVQELKAENDALRADIRWLDGTLGADALKPAAESELREWPVSKRVNRSGVGDDDPTIIEKNAA
jgi:hypothetical protein